MWLPPPSICFVVKVMAKGTRPRLHVEPPLRPEVTMLKPGDLASCHPDTLSEFSGSIRRWLERPTSFRAKAPVASLSLGLWLRS